jgi:hypothetical protein
MRPARFEAFLLDLAKNDPTTSRVQTVSEAGDRAYQWGLIAVTSAGESRWQIIGQLAPGAKHDSPDEAVEGDPVPAGDGPQAGDSPEAWLAALLARSENREIESIERWSTRKDAPGSQGVTVTFRSGAKIFARLT